MIRNAKNRREKRVIHSFNTPCCQDQFATETLVGVGSKQARTKTILTFSSLKLNDSTTFILFV